MTALTQMPFADADAVESNLLQLWAGRIRGWPWPKIVFEVFPGISQPTVEGARRFKPGMHHAVFTTRIASAALFIHAIFCPIDFG